MERIVQITFTNTVLGNAVYWEGPEAKLHELAEKNGPAAMLAKKTCNDGMRRTLGMFSCCIIGAKRRYLRVTYHARRGHVQELYRGDEEHVIKCALADEIYDLAECCRSVGDDGVARVLYLHPTMETCTDYDAAHWLVEEITPPKEEQACLW